MTRIMIGAMGQRLAGLAATLALGAVGCSAAAGEESVEASKSEIVNGVVMNDADVSVFGLVALYHHDAGSPNWFIRPCSATILKSVAGVSWILTARHCVTASNTIMGAKAATSSLRLVAAASPGLANPNPPAGITPDAIFVPDAPAEIPAHDFALVRANVGWASRVGYRTGLWVGSPSTLIRVKFQAMGYGISVNDTTCSSPPYPSIGAGTARFGGEFKIQSAAATAPSSYSFLNQSTDGQSLFCGDSGGPDFAGLGTEDFGWTHLIGVHSTGAGLPGSSASSAVTGTWVQDQLGGLYLSSDWSRTLDLGQAGTQTLLVSVTDPRAVRLRYDPADQRIQLVGSSMCLARNTSNLIQFLSCSTSSGQKWTISADRQFQNAQNGQCLTVSEINEASLQPCSWATEEIAKRQHWAFHPQP
jgi:hypothetical protein